MRFIHTADWQLGLRMNFVDGDDASRLRALRYSTVERIAQRAKEHEVDFVVVAGDVLDDNALGLDALQQTEDALSAFGDTPVFLLPGNHDAATEDSALRRLKLPSGCQFVEKREAISIAGGKVFPCPLQQRHEFNDPTEWLPEKAGSDEIWVAVAHGGVIDFNEGDDGETPNLIDAQRVVGKGFDYVALGDWHGQLKISDCIWYSGAHEATRFKEKKPGYILLVDIEAPGATPSVESIHVAQTEWISWQITFNDDDQVDELQARLEQLPRRSTTLLNLVADGSLSIAARAQLDELLDEYRGRLPHLRLDTTALQTTPTDADLETMSADGFVQAALEELKASNEPNDELALRLMYRLQQQELGHAAT